MLCLPGKWGSVLGFTCITGYPTLQYRSKGFAHLNKKKKHHYGSFPSANKGKKVF